MKRLNEIIEILDSHGVRYQFSFEDLKSKKVTVTGESNPFPFASCYKLAVLGATLDCMNDPSILEEKVSVKPNDLSELASGILNTLTLPVDLSLDNLLKLMMIYSDGVATDLLQDRLGHKVLDEYVSRVIPNSKITHNIKKLIQRIVEAAPSQNGEVERKAYYEAIQKFTVNEDYTTANDVVNLLKHVYSGGDLHRKYLMVEAANPRMNAYSGSKVRIKGKTGTLGFFASTNDCGFIVRGNEPVAVFAMLTQGWTQPRYLIENAFGEIGRILCSEYDSTVYSAAYSNQIG